MPTEALLLLKRARLDIFSKGSCSIVQRILFNWELRESEPTFFESSIALLFRKLDEGSSIGISGFNSPCVCLKETTKGTWSACIHQFLFPWQSKKHWMLCLEESTFTVLACASYKKANLLSNPWFCASFTMASSCTTNTDDFLSYPSDDKCLKAFWVFLCSSSCYFIQFGLYLSVLFCLLVLKL